MVTTKSASQARGKAAPGDEQRVASRGKRDRFSARSWGGRLSNNDPTIEKFSNGRGIGLYTQILHQFANVAGYCQAWVDHILVTDRVIKPAKGKDAAEQEIADAAATRAQLAWASVGNRSIVLQKLLMGRFYGFARAEKVPVYIEVLGEWVPFFYDVPQESWRFDDDGREYLVTTDAPNGAEIDPSRFIHFQWGSADSKYGKGDLSYVYLSLWKIQKLETMALQRIEDSESTVIVHVPRGIVGDQRTALENAYAEEFRKTIFVPSEEGQVRTELPTQNIAAAGATARQEYEAIRFHERWVQTMLLGAPQTGDKALGTGKLEDTRKAIWDDKSPIGSAALDQCLTVGWLSTYCDWNMADLPRELRPRFESDSTDIAEGLAGLGALEARNIALDLSAKKITPTIAIELWGALGLPRARAQAMSDSILKERDTLDPAKPEASTPEQTTDEEAA